HKLQFANVCGGLEVTQRKALPYIRQQRLRNHRLRRLLRQRSDTAYLGERASRTLENHGTSVHIGASDRGHDLVVRRPWRAMHGLPTPPGPDFFSHEWKKRREESQKGGKRDEHRAVG